MKNDVYKAYDSDQRIQNSLIPGRVLLIKLGLGLDIDGIIVRILERIVLS